MAWFRVDDSFPVHRKVLALRRGAERLRCVGLWTLAGALSARDGLGGRVPDSLLEELGATQKDVEALVRVGLWVRREDAEFHDWSVYNPDAATVAAQRVKESESGALGNHRRWHVKRGLTVPECEFCYRVPDREPDAYPDPPPDRGSDRVSIARNPIPVPDKNEPADAGSPGGGVIARINEPASAAQALIAEWIDHCAERPPSRVVGQVAKELKALLDEGIPAARVREALAEWNRKGLHPSALASVVHEVANRKPAPRRGDIDWQAAADRAAAKTNQLRGELA